MVILKFKKTVFPTMKVLFFKKDVDIDNILVSKKNPFSEKKQSILYWVLVWQLQI